MENIKNIKTKIFKEKEGKELDDSKNENKKGKAPKIKMKKNVQMEGGQDNKIQIRKRQQIKKHFFLFSVLVVGILFISTYSSLGPFKSRYSSLCRQSLGYYNILFFFNLFSSLCIKRKTL